MDSQALQALAEMEQNGIKPDKTVYNALVEACINSQCPSLADLPNCQDQPDFPALLAKVGMQRWKS